MTLQGTIQKLSAEVIGQIAAGEVVERPASAVKELVENSIDAGATAITVELREGGISYLRVSDNGRGIPASQIRMAFERHATSKITRSEDLFDVHTLGFRGEALASIAAVSKISLTTRTAEEAFGVRALAEAGEIKEIREAATPVGTTIVVEELFFNTPVRLKFLKKPGMEASLVSDYMMRLILSRPDISFRFANQGKTVYQSVGDGSVQSALYCVLGKDAIRQMHKVHGTESGLILDGFVGVGELSRGNRQLQSFFVNGRYFRDAVLSKALESGCQGRVMIGKFPCCALYLQLPYEQVDVNVHPNKLEVRFQNQVAVASAIEALVRDALRAETLGNRLAGGLPTNQAERREERFAVVPLAPKDEADEIESESAVTEGQAEAADTAGEAGKAAPFPKQQGLEPVVVQRPMPGGVLRETTAPPRVQAAMQPLPDGVLQGYAPLASAKPTEQAAAETAREAGDSPETGQVEPPRQESMLEEEALPRLRLIGVAFQSYWLFEAGERLLWVDQHAAHERVLYDKLWKQYEGGHISQRLLSPQLVQLTAQECAMVAELSSAMEEAGFDVRPFDDRAVAVHAIPTIFGRNEPARELLLEALNEWQAQRGQVTRERMRKQVIQMACKKAIKAGDRLTDAEVMHLLSEMLRAGITPTCPHGRPIVVETGRRDLEKRFKRIQ